MTGMRYMKNALVLTGCNALLRLAGLAFRIWLVGMLGARGMGLYMQVLAVYGLFLTVATAGLSAAATCLLAEELSYSEARAHTMLRTLLAASLGLGIAAGGAQYYLAKPIAYLWLGDALAVRAIHSAALGLPFAAVSSVFRGYFFARRQVLPGAVSQIAEQISQIGLTAWWLNSETDLAGDCSVLLKAGAVAEAVGAGVLSLWYQVKGKLSGKAKKTISHHTVHRIWAMFWPVESGQCLAAGLHTAEHILVPACLTAALAGSMGRQEAMTQYGALEGMAIPILLFPLGLFGTLSTLLVPELVQKNTQKNKPQLQKAIDNMLTLTAYSGAFIGAAVWVWAEPICMLLYDNLQAGRYLHLLACIAPTLYIECMVAGALKAVQQQQRSFYCSAIVDVLNVAGIIFIVPRWGMEGLLAVMGSKCLLISGLHLYCLLKTQQISFRFVRWLVKPFAAAIVAVGVGRGVSLCFGWYNWSALIAGSCAALLIWGGITLGFDGKGLMEEMRANCVEKIV